MTSKPNKKKIHYFGGTSCLALNLKRNILPIRFKNLLNQILLQILFNKVLVNRKKFILTRFKFLNFKVLFKDYLDRI